VAPHDARVLFFGVTDFAGFVQILGFQANVCDGWFRIPVGNFRKVVANLCDLAALLRCIIFIGETALGLRFDVECVGLCAVRGSDQGIMRLGAAFRALDFSLSGLGFHKVSPRPDDPRCPPRVPKDGAGLYWDFSPAATAASRVGRFRLFLDRTQPQRTPDGSSR
jgi:hypothetical protein